MAGMAPSRQRASPEPAAPPSRDEARPGHWTFFTNHAHVLFVLAREPELRLRDVAARVQITERAAQRIVRDLEEAGYLRVRKSGRRNTYEIHPELFLRHPVEAHCRVEDVLRVIEGRRSRRG